MCVKLSPAAGYCHGQPDERPAPPARRLDDRPKSGIMAARPDRPAAE